MTIFYLSSSKSNSKPLLCLFDSGSSHTWVNEKVIPSDAPIQLDQQIVSHTMAGIMKDNRVVLVKEAVLPEFFSTHKLTNIQMQVFSTACHYDIIMGHDMLQDLVLGINLKNTRVHWEDSFIPMRPHLDVKQPETLKTNSQQNIANSKIETDNDVTFVYVTEKPRTIDEIIAQPHVEEGYKSKIIT